MSLDTVTLIALFPIAFILHDFEELMLFEPWLKKNAGAIISRVQNRVPAFVEKQVSVIVGKSTAQFAFPIFLIFVLTCVSSLLAVEFGAYSPFLFASSLFFLHGFMHVGQAIVLRKYVPALITSVFIVIPYGAVLFWRLIAAGIVDSSELPVYFLGAIVLVVPFIIGMHVAGEYVYKRVVDILVG